MTDIDAYIAARGRALGCQANGWRREWYRESMKGELTEMLDIAADETGETISALAEALDLAARIWSEENERNI